MLTVWGQAVLATGGSLFYFHILSIKKGVALNSEIRMYVRVRGMTPIVWVEVSSGLGQIVDVESMGESIKSHSMFGLNFSAKQGCEFVPVNNKEVLPSTEHVGQLLEDEAG
eukprot:758205-Pelagomonas_calceolata.AAC.1